MARQEWAWQNTTQKSSAKGKHTHKHTSASVGLNTTTARNRACAPFSEVTNNTVDRAWLRVACLGFSQDRACCATISSSSDDGTSTCLCTTTAHERARTELRPATDHTVDCAWLSVAWLCLVE